MPDDVLSAVFAPATWIDLLTEYTAKRDMFSAKSLMTILEGIEQLAAARGQPNCPFTVTAFHSSLFERLQQSFNNPALLKAVGLLYLGEFKLPGAALKHFDLARQYAPKDRDIEHLQKAAAVSLAKAATDAPQHTGVDEAPGSKPAVGDLIRKTTRLSMVDTRAHLDESSDEFERRQKAWRKSGALPQPAAPVPKEDYTHLLKQAEVSIHETDFTGAAFALGTARQMGAPPEELLAYYAQLGLAAFDHGRMAEALEAYALLRDLNPEAMEGWFNCGLVYQKVGQLEDALTSYREAIRLDPANAKSWCNLSSVLFESGQLPEAEEAARKAIELRPDYARAWDNLASVLGAVNRLPEAAEACQTAIRFQSNLHSAWFKLGVINFQLDNFVAAMEAFSLTGDNPDFFGYVLYYLSMIESRRGNLDAALQKLAQARAADPTNDLEGAALKEVAAACTKLGRDATAADFYGQAVARQPEDYSAWVAKAAAHHRLEQFDKAREGYLQAIRIQPDNPASWHNLGLLASDQGNHAESRDCFQREVDLVPDDAKAWYDLAVSLQALGQEEEGQAAYEKAEALVKGKSRRSSDLSAALSIVRRLNLGDRVLKT